MVTSTSTNRSKSLGDPNSRYESLKGLWRTSRALLNGQNQAKALDTIVDARSNILLPFSPSMSQEQYDFYKAEAELPGLTAQYAKVLTSGLLRKPPLIELPADAPEGAKDWLENQFTSDNQSMLSFLDEAIWEEMQTSRAWIYVDYPSVPNMDLLTPAEQKMIRPYPIIIPAESVINWKTSQHPITRELTLTRLLTRSYQTKYDNNAWHPDYVDTVFDHYINPSDGMFYIDVYERNSEQGENVEFINGVAQQDYHVTGGSNQNNQNDWKKVRTIDNLFINDKRMTEIPCYPLNGSLNGIEPMLMPLIDREVALYNKVSRRNHLLLGSATYTPVISSDMTDDRFEDIVDGGLGSWIRLDQGDTVTSFEAPSKALRDMENAISSTISEMARMGIRMLSPDNGSGRDSGVALEIRNAGQTAILASLNAKISQQMKKIIVIMMNWRYDTEYTVNDLGFTLTPDLNPAPLGSDWLRLVTEWYQNGIIPRSTFLEIAKANDILPTDYDDEEGINEIKDDDLIINPQEELDTTTLEETVRQQLNGSQTDEDEEDKPVT
jgi:hypothetical protein